MDAIEQALTNLGGYLEKEDFKGYDPYDTLNSWIPFHWLGKWGPVLGIQFQKRNPVNIRPILGIKKEINPKAYGLFLQAYSLLFSITGKEEHKQKATNFFNWLSENRSDGYSGSAWGYNFPWASPEKYLKSFEPTAVVTGFVCRGIYEYYKITKDSRAKELLNGASVFIMENLPVHEDSNGICISYTSVKQDYCYNASLLAAEVLAISGTLDRNDGYRKLAIKAVNWVIHHQKENGRWNYSIDILSGKEREQIDFHQGYILESIFNIKNILEISDNKWEQAILKGSEFYYKQQFLKNGLSLWRFPKIWPIEIHNQSQGIITFTKLKDYKTEFIDFATIIANWSIANMQSKKGYFYYRLYKHYKIRIPYMRWSQAWMMLALITLNFNNHVKGEE